MRRKALSWCAAVAAVVGLAQTASASSITLYANPAAGSIGVEGNAAPGFGSGSWQGNPVGSPAKSEFYFSPAFLGFSGPVLFSDINSISYWTNKPGTAGDPDWALYIYTKPTGTDDSAGWYKSRLTAEPYFTNTASVPANTWHEWSTSDPTNPLRFYDAPRAGYFGTYTDPTLATLQGGSYTWTNPITLAQATHDYRNEEILFFSLQTGSGWANGFNGLVAGPLGD